MVVKLIQSHLFLVIPSHHYPASKLTHPHMFARSSLLPLPLDSPCPCMFQAHVIDAPILVKVEHGTLRYRYKEDGGEDPPPGNNRKRKKKGRIEVAHEGPERSKKHGYFFHSTLNDFSESKRVFFSEKFIFFFQLTLTFVLSTG